MPRIPSASDLPQVQRSAGRAARIPLFQPPASNLAAIGEGIARIGFDLREQRQDAERSMALNEVAVVLPQELDQVLLRMQTEALPGAKDFAATYMDSATGVVDQFLADVSARYDLRSVDQRLLSESARAMLAPAHSAALRFEDVERRRLYQDATERSLEAAAATAYRNPDAIDLAMTQKQAIISNAGHALSPQQLVELNQKYDREIPLRAVQGRIENDPVGTLRALRQGEFDELVGRGLRASDLAALEDEAFEGVKAMLALRDTEEARAHRERTEAQEEEARRLRIGIIEGTVGQTDLLDSARVGGIDNGQLASLFSFMTSPDSEYEDKDIVLNLLRGIHEGTVDAEDVMAARASLKTTTARALLNTADEVVRRGSVLARADVKRERKRVDETIGGVEGAFAKLDPALSERNVNALDEFDQRVLAGEDARMVADELIKMNSFRRAPRTLSGLGRPRYFDAPITGTKQELQAAVALAEHRTLQAYKNGEIDRTIALNEMRRIEEYKLVIDQMDEGPERVTQ